LAGRRGVETDVPRDNGPSRLAYRTSPQSRKRVEQLIDIRFGEVHWPQSSHGAGGASMATWRALGAVVALPVSARATSALMETAKSSLATSTSRWGTSSVRHASNARCAASIQRKKLCRKGQF